MDNIGLKSIIVKGKSFNTVDRWYNKELVRLRSQYTAQEIETGTALLW